MNNPIQEQVTPQYKANSGVYLKSSEDASENSSIKKIWNWNKNQILVVMLSKNVSKSITEKWKKEKELEMDKH